MRDIFQARNRLEAEARLAETIKCYEKRAPKFCRWLEESGPEGMVFYSRPQEHWKKIRTVNLVERLK